jgi:thiol-disulfide isomerase/thioredoxin
LKFALFLLVLLPASLYAQTNGIYDYPGVKKYAVNLFVENASGKMYDIKTIDRFIRGRVPVTLTDETIKGDTAYWTIILSMPFQQEKTLLYKKYMHKPLPDFTVTDIHGKSISTTELRGKVVLLNFWKTTCVPCTAAIPYLNRLADSLPADRFVLLAPGLDSLGTIEKFLFAHPFRYDVVPSGGALASLLGVTNFPTNLVIDPSGKMIAVNEALTVDTLTYIPLIKEELESALKKIRK